jgi:hypothetical protein
VALQAPSFHFISHRQVRRRSETFRTGITEISLALVAMGRELDLNECPLLAQSGHSLHTLPMTDSEILQTAKVLIEAHGDNAWLEAAQRADHAYEDNKLKAFKNWQRVLRAIEALQNVHIGKTSEMH